MNCRYLDDGRNHLSSQQLRIEDLLGDGEQFGAASRWAQARTGIGPDGSDEILSEELGECLAEVGGKPPGRPHAGGALPICFLYADTLDITVPAIPDQAHLH
jgi:hypothetical protein